MEFASAFLGGAASSSPAAKSEGKPKFPVEEDLLSLLGEGGGVDCTLQLALPGCAASRCPRAPAAEVACLIRRPESIRRPSGWCTMCGRTETPLWRHGPHGPKSLCNACGIRYKKEEKQSRLTLGTPASHWKTKLSS